MNKNHVSYAVAILAAALLSATQVAFAVDCPTGNAVRTVAPSPLTGEAKAVADTESLRAAIAVGGAVILGGDYYVNAAIYMSPSASSVFICSINGASIKQVAGGGSVIIEGTMQSNGAMLPLNQVSIQNITFDGGGVKLQGNNIKVVGNKFINIENIDAQSGLFLVNVRNGEVSGNKFVNIWSGGVAAADVRSTIISDNNFTDVSQGITINTYAATDSDVFADRNIIKNNVMTGLSRMGIEFGGTYPVHPKNPLIDGNRMTDWVVDTRGRNAEETARRNDRMALSIVRGRDAVISNNVVSCGDICSKTESIHGYGVEIFGAGTPKVQNNTITGFWNGVIIDAPTENVEVTNNAIYRSVIAISRDEKEPATKNIKIDGNYIENAREIGVRWRLNDALVQNVTNNIISRSGGAWSDDSTKKFVGFNISNLLSVNASTVNLSGNKIIFEGPVVAGFVARGIELNGYRGNLGGLNVDNNFVGNFGSSKFGVGIFASNSEGEAIGVKLTGNVLQNLATSTTGPDGAYATPSRNKAINMTGSALFAAQSVPIPAIKLTKTSTGTGPWTVTLSTPYRFAPQTWFFGDGSTSSEQTLTVSHPYLLPAKRTVRLLQTHSSGATFVGTTSVIQP